MELKDLKKGYDELAKKFKIPGFKEINQDFEVDKIDRDTDNILRAIRKAMMDKIVNSLGFVEMLLNPANAPRLYHGFLKTMTSEEKQILDKMYGLLSELSVSSLELEIDSSDKLEAELIKRVQESWNSAKPDFKRILAKVKNPINDVVKKEKSYFG